MRFSFFITLTLLFALSARAGEVGTHGRGAAGQQQQQGQQRQGTGLGGLGEASMGRGAEGGGAAGGGGGGGGGANREGSKAAGEEARKAMEKGTTEFATNAKALTDGFSQVVKGLPQEDTASAKFFEELKKGEKDKEKEDKGEEGAKSSVDMLVDGIIQGIQTQADLQITGMQQKAQAIISTGQASANQTVQRNPTVSESLESYAGPRRRVDPIAAAFGSQPADPNGAAAGGSSLGLGNEHPTTGGEARGFATGSRVYNPPAKTPTIR